MSQDVFTIPSPQQIEQYKTPNGGWTRHDLANWGVPWPPPNGWKEQLENAYRSGFTVGMILECIGCREGKYFIDYDPYPVCSDCQTWEQERHEKQYQEPSIIKRVVNAFRKPKQEMKYKKEPIPVDLRWEVWERDNYTCQHCGSRKKLTVDHIFPESKGGQLTMDNVQTLCKSCNSRKGAR